MSLMLGPLMFVVALGHLYRLSGRACAGRQRADFAAIGVGAGAFDWALMNVAARLFGVMSTCPAGGVSIFMGTMLSARSSLKICSRRSGNSSDDFVAGLRSRSCSSARCLLPPRAWSAPPSWRWG